MRFNPLTRRLFTDDLRLIKQMHCPARKQWQTMAPAAQPGVRTCDLCQHPVIDTALHSDEELLHMLTQAPETCLKLDFNQANLIITPHDAHQ